MKRIVGRPAFALTLLCLLARPAVFAAEGDDILKRMDANRGLDSFAFLMQIDATVGDELKDSYQLTGYIRNTPRGNTSLLYFSEPAAIRGRKMLMDGNFIWMLFPNTRNPIRLSPMQVLLGEAANGDVARTNFSWDYDVVTSAVKQREGVEVYELDLKVKAAKRGSTYSRIVLIVEKAGLRALSGDFYAESGKLMKKVRYRDYTDWKGYQIPLTLEIQDALDQSKRTIMRYLKLADKQLPELYYRKEYLEEFKYVPLG
jgi:outer membrane lipoprotein-sorting protein